MFFFKISQTVKTSVTSHEPCELSNRESIGEDMSQW